MTLYLLKKEDKYNKVGIVVSKKFSKSSVKRNRVKRLIKECYRLNEDRINTGYLIVIMIKNNTKFENINYENISNDFNKCLKKACLIRNDDAF